MKVNRLHIPIAVAVFCLLCGIFSPSGAVASVGFVNQWPATPTIVSDSNTGTVSGKFTPGLGANRLMLVAIATEYTSAQAPTFTVTYGGQPLTGTILNNTSQVNKIWLGYFDEAAVSGGSSGSKIISVTNSVTTNLTAMYVTVAVFNGVDQATPIVASQSNSTAGATSLALTAFNVSSLGLVAYVSNWAGQTSNVATSGYAEIRDWAGTNMNIAAGYSVFNTAGTTAPTSTAAASAAGAFAAVSLNPLQNVNKITTCGGCHGYFPNDGTARNAPPGMFPGSHEKHAGGDDIGYTYACTKCHYNNTANSHSNGFINVTGSSLPGNVYSKGKSFAVSNNPTFGNCGNLYCHSSGRATGMGTRQYSSARWGGKETCLGCHGGRSTTNPYPPARSIGNFTLTTSHSQHLKYSATDVNCQICHSKTAINATTLKNYTGVQRHVNGVADVYFTNLAYASYTSYKSNKSCANTSCHGGKTRSSWSNTAQNTDHSCSHCHGTAGTPASTQVTGTNRYNLRFFAPGYKKTGTIGTSTDQNIASNDIRVGSHFKHLSSAYMKNIKCNECHKVPSTPFSTDTNHSLNTLRFNSGTLDFSQSSSARILIGVAAGSTPAQLAAFNGYTNGTATKAATCSSVYCHGNRLKGGDTTGSYLKPYWNYSAMVNYTDKANACGRCHGNPPRHGSYSTTHINKAATYSCSGCHNSVVNANGDIINKNLHINGRVEATGGHEWSFGGLKHKNGGTGSIQANPTTYSNCTGCHSITGGGTYPVARGVASNINCQICHTNTTNLTSTPGCADCHGTNATGQPNGAYSAFPNWSGSHSSHTAQSYVCSDCHNNAGSGYAIHGNYSAKAAKTRADVNVNFNTAKSGTAAAYSSASMQCSTSTCHGQKSPAWGSAVPVPKCVRCHGYQSLATLDNYTQNSIAPGTGNIDTGRLTGITARGGMHQEHLKGASNISRKVRCIECHASTTAVNHAQLDNMTTAALTFSGVATALSHTPTVSRVSGIINCSTNECHHGGNRVDGTAAGQSGFLSRPALAWNNSGLLDNSTVTGTCSAKCHYLPPGAGQSGDTHQALSAVTTFAGLTGCSSQTGGTGCHPSINGSAAANISGIFFDKNLHINGTVEGGSCTSCHNQAQSTYRRQVVSKSGAASEFSVTAQLANMTSHVKTANISEKTCEVCHAQSSHKTYTDGVQVKLWNTRAASGTGTIVYDGTTKSLNNFCIGCHDSTGFANIANMRPSGSTATATAPYADSGDNNAPDDIFTNWSAAAITSNGTPSGTRKTHQGLVNCMDCHGDSRTNSTTTPRINAHASSNGKFLRYSTTKAVTTPTGTYAESQTCFNKTSGCHGPVSTLAYTGARVFYEFKVNGAAATAGAHPILQAATPKSTNLQADTNGANFVNGWKPSSVATCSDCHGGASYTGPKGPHGSSYPYLLKGANTTAYTVHTDGSAFGTPNTAGSAAIFCLNCHASDVYGDGGVSTVTGNKAGTLAGHGSTHTMSTNTGNCGGVSNSVEGVGCKNCHAGAGRGGTHSTSTGGTSAVNGGGFMNGNCWTAAPTASTCYATTRSAENGTWSSCTKGNH